MAEVTLAITRTGGAFEVLVAGNVIGKAAYKTYDGGREAQRIFYHTGDQPGIPRPRACGQARYRSPWTKRLSWGSPSCRCARTSRSSPPSTLNTRGSTTATTPADLEFLNDTLTPHARELQGALLNPLKVDFRQA